MSYNDYGDVDGWRQFSGLDTSAISTARATVFLEQSIQQVTRECSQFIRDENVTKDGNGYYFINYRYLSDYETASPDAVIETDDVKVYEFNSTSRLLTDISSQVASIDGLNCYFTLNSGYPTDDANVYVSYRSIGQPLSELVGSGSVLQKAVYNYMTILGLKELKKLRLRNGIISYTSGGETVTRNEDVFDKMVEQHIQTYQGLINYCKPFYGRRSRTGHGFGGYSRLPRAGLHSDRVWQILNRN